MPTSKEIWRQLEEAGWICVRSNGDHFTFKHKDVRDIITIVHPRKDNPTGYVKRIEKITGLKIL
ncbi:MAG: type II toxin-antitoxin system HicA family toxin [Magnetospirillum sp.]|nr:type II toxin-antitoxin system HicA family toxin [Magnetospirillum sp.]